MAKRFLFFFYLFFFWFGSTEAKEELTLHAIPQAMNRIFQYHIENKQLTPTLVKRSFKIYIEQFDPKKVYLLEEEVTPYFQMSDKKALQIVEKYQKGDFSDYVALNQMIQKAITRSQKMRGQVAQELSRSKGNVSLEKISIEGYAKSPNEIMERQKDQMVRFFVYHQRRIPLDTENRRIQIFQLYEKKLRHGEYAYLFLEAQQRPFSAEKANHYLALRILKALSKSLDAHTFFFSEDEARMVRVNLEKQFEGFGVVLSEGVEGVFVTEVIKGSPAEKSGKIKPNDYLISINGQSLKGATFEEILNLLKNNNSLVLGIQRFDFSNPKAKPKSWEVAIEKMPIVMESDRLTYSTEPFGDGVIGKMTLHSFYESGNGIDSASDIRRALTEMRKQGPIYGLVLDLRENSGGFLSQAVKVAGLFITSGVVVISKYSHGETQYLRKVDTKATYSGPLIVLTSKLSASASEIVAQALQDYGAALIVGDQRTFGKGSIQYQTLTDPKADLFFKVTIGRYYTVSGRSTQIHGVQADILVPTLFSAYNVGEKFLEYPLPADTIPSAYNDNLSDVDARAKFWFQKNYLPNLQKKIPIWKNMLPKLRENSEKRLLSNPNFQLFLRRQEIIRARQQGKEPTRVIEVDENYGVEDLQMQESVEIIKDMISIQAESKNAAKAA